MFADWLTAGRGEAPWVVAVGEIARGEEEDPAVQSVTITDPRGESRVVPVKEGEWVYDGTTRAGLYTVQAGPRTVAFAVNLLSRAESDIRPRGSVSIGRQQVQAEEVGKVKRRRELWRWLVLAAVGMLGGEWLFFHKRGG